MADMFGWTIQDVKDAKVYLSETLKAQSESYYEDVSLGYAERDRAKERSFKFLKIAIANVDSQIPKKPTDIYVCIPVMGTCPVCGVRVYDCMKHCYICGQALDWNMSENPTYCGGNNNATD